MYHYQLLPCSDGTVYTILTLSPSAVIWSLLGHHILAPSPSQETAIQSRLSLSLDHVNPPAQGGLSAL